MGCDVSGFVFIQEPNREALQHLPVGLGIKGYRHQTKPVWLLDVWKCDPGERYPMTFGLPDECQPLIKLPVETESVLEQLRAIAIALREIDPIDRLADIRWSASISALCGVETTFYSANDDTVNMAVRWNAGQLQTARISTGRFLITNGSSASLMIQQVINLEDDDSPWQCPPEVEEALRAIPGLSSGETLTVESNSLLHSNALALWPKEAVFAQEMLGICNCDSQPEAWKEFVVEFERACPSAEALRPSLDFQGILQHAQTEAAKTLKTNRKLDPQQPLVELGFNMIDATVFILTLEKIYFVKIPLAKYGSPQRLTLQRLTELIISAAALSSSPPAENLVVSPVRQQHLGKATASSAAPTPPPTFIRKLNWYVQDRFVLALWLLGGMMAGYYVGEFAGWCSPSLKFLCGVLPLIALVVIFVLGALGRLPGTRPKK